MKLVFKTIIVILWRVSDCEELSGGGQSQTKNCDFLIPSKLTIYKSLVLQNNKVTKIESNGRSLCMQSTRHSVETHLTNQNVNPRYIDFLQGHSQKGTGGNTYMKGIKPEVLLKECVDKIQFEIDWEKLKVKW